MTGLLSRIPNWWPVAVGIVILILALGETRWEIQRHTGREAIQEAEKEELQWTGIGNLNRQVTQLEGWRAQISGRLSDTTFQDWVADRARKDAKLLELEEDIENLKARINRLEAR